MRKLARISALILTSGGTLLAGACGAVSETIGAAFSIADIWF